MKLNYLKLKNFRQHRDVSIEFSSQLNSIIGPNWAGKSNLLASIRYALFGTKAISGTEDTLITWGEKAFKLELSFELGDKTYLIERTKSSAHISENGNGMTLVASGKSQVAAFIEENLGLKQADFDLFIMAKQGETEAALTYGATALNRKLEEFSNLSLLDQVQSVARERAAEKTAEASNIRPYEEDVRALLEQSEEALKEVAEAQHAQQMEEASTFRAKHELGQYVTQAPIDAEALRRLRDKYLSQSHKMEMAENASAAAEAAYHEKSIRWESLKLEYEQVVEELGDVSTTLAQHKAQVDSISGQLKGRRQYETELKRVNEDFDRLSKLYSAIEERYPEAGDMSIDLHLEALVRALTERKESLSKALQEENDNIAVLLAEIKKFESAQKDAICPTCKRPFEGHDPADIQRTLEQKELLRQEATAERNNVKKELAMAESDLAKCEKDHWALSRITKEASELVEPLPPTEETVEELEQARDDAIAAYSRQEADSKRINVAKKALEAANQERLRAEKKRIEAMGALEATKAALADLDPITEEQVQEAMEIAEAQRKHTAELNKAYLEAAARLAVAEKSLAHAEENKAKLEARAKEYRERKERADEIDKVADQYKRLASFLANNRAGYLKEVWDRVLAVASRQLDVSTSGAMTALRFIDGKFYFVQDGLDTPIELASGAQKAFCGVALRVGLSRALYGSTALLIFDEPTAAMSEHNASALVSTMTSIAKQVILVSHRETDRALASNVVELSTA